MWEFYDFIDSQGSVIEQWLASLRGRPIKKIAARLHTYVDNLRRMSRDEWGDIIGPMTGDEWHKIFHFRFTFQGVQYRPLLCYGPGEMAVTFLMGAEEHDGVIEPTGTLRVVQERRMLVEGEAGITNVVRHRVA